MSDQARQDELAFLSDCFAEASNIDQAVQAGVTTAHFTHQHHRNLWGLLLDLRGAGKHTDEATVYAEASNRGVLPGIGGVEGLVAATSATGGLTTLNAPARRAVLLDLHAKRESYKLLQRAVKSLADGTASLEDVRGLAEQVAERCTLNAQGVRPVSDIAAEAIQEAEEAIAGTKETGKHVLTGIPSFDKYATPIHMHEYVLVAGRSSHGKSSFMLQVAGHNIRRGLKVAVFSLETSDKAVVKQLAAQRAEVNLRELKNALPDHQQRYLEGLRYLESGKQIMVFDRDLSIDAIESRCRLIKQSFKPDLVVLDYIGLVSGTEGTAYERASQASKRMVPLQKALGCTLMVGCQLNQGPEKDAREPGRTDFRDSGQLLEDAHRVIAVWRKPNQALDNQWFDCELLQLKLRDGGLCKVPCRFHAQTTRFVESAPEY